MQSIKRQPDMQRYQKERDQRNDLPGCTQPSNSFATYSPIHISVIVYSEVRKLGKTLSESYSNDSTQTIAYQDVSRLCDMSVSSKYLR